MKLKMNNYTCIYCCEFFCEGRRLPMKLECGHIICSDCVYELKFYLTNCPIDNVRVNFKDLKVNEYLKNKLSSLCKLHQCIIVSYCETHVEILCQKCSLSHIGCKVWEGSYNQIEEKLNKNYENSVLIALQINQSYIGDIEDIEKYLALIATEYKAKIYEIQENIDNIKSARSQKLLFFLQKFALIFNKSALQDFKSQVIMLSNNSNQLNSVSNLEKMYPAASESPISHNTVYQTYQFYKDLIGIYLPFTMNSIIVTYASLVSKRFSATVSLVKDDHLSFNMIGLSRPSMPNGVNNIINLEITCKNKTLAKIQNIEISYLKDKFFYVLILSEILEIQSKIEILVEVKGIAYYLFTEPAFGNIAKMVIMNEYPLVEAFPVCIIGCDRNPEVLNIVNDSNFV